MSDLPLVCPLPRLTSPSSDLPLVCRQVSYRRNGHNEIDEPMFTHPFMYSKVRQLPNLLHKYSQQLIAEGVVTEHEFKVSWSRGQVRSGHGRRTDEDWRLAGPRRAACIPGGLRAAQY